MAMTDQTRHLRGRSTTAALRVVALALLIVLCLALVMATVTFVDRTVAVSLISAAGVSLLAGLLIAMRPDSARVRHSTRPHAYAQRLDELTAAVRGPSKELDRLLDELTEVAADRQSALDALTAQLATLAAQEHELRERNNGLLNVSVPALKAFAELNAESEKRSEYRDYLLFGLGVAFTIVTTLIAAVLQGI